MIMPFEGHSSSIDRSKRDSHSHYQMRVSWSKVFVLTSATAVAMHPQAAMAQDFVRTLGYASQQGLNAAAVGCLYALLAVAYSLIHGITSRIVLSFGDIAMFAAFYASYVALMLL